MSGRHRRPRTTPGRLALLGTVPLVGGAGLAAALTGGADGTDPAPGVVPTAAAGTTATDTTATDTATVHTGEPVAVPGRGEVVLDAVGGARDAALRAGDAQTAGRVSTVAAELRDQAQARADAARAAGDAELAAYHRDEAARQDRAAESSRPVVADELPAEADEEEGVDLTEPAPLCRAADVVRLGPLTATGPQCDTDPWIAGQVDDAMRRGAAEHTVG
ncbi:hypothetical protein [Pseudonocardia sp. ICBG1293]|uniref:hypothetical protein n=1 Tax=Pseudonocardia sp. ICBG1293 TaxID=2844382 RepID=UPI001CCA20FE|nr:hypothetical protein [Pseudonocardia sp. ICBG1293]